jgi:hypothetical protein
MPITLSCKCGKQLRTKDEFAGKKIKCPGCGVILAIPAAAPSPETAVAAPTAPLAKDLPLQFKDEGPLPPKIVAPPFPTEEDLEPIMRRPGMRRQSRRVDDADAGAVPRFLFIPAVLPVIIPILTRGGLVPSVIGAGFAGACASVARIKKWPVVGRFFAALGLVVLAYALFFVFLVIRVGWNELMFDIEMWFTGTDEPLFRASFQLRHFVIFKLT